jgi:hypothetical protein
MTLPNADQRPYCREILKEKKSFSLKPKELLDKIDIIVDYKLPELKEKFLEVFIQTKLKEKHISFSQNELKSFLCRDLISQKRHRK